MKPTCLSCDNGRSLSIDGTLECPRCSRRKRRPRNQPVPPAGSGWLFPVKPLVSVHTSRRGNGVRDVWIRVVGKDAPSVVIQLDHDRAMELANEIVQAAEPWRLEKIT